MLLVLALSACGGGSSEQDVQAAVAEALASQKAAEPAPSPAAVVADPTPAEPTPAEAEAGPTPALVDFAMPNLVGSNLQDAQNEIQTLGVFFSISHDLLGSRSQILDSNWQVCDQTPGAGTRIKGPAADYEGKFDLGAVKLTETCP